MTVVRSHQPTSHTGTLAVAHQPILDADAYPHIRHRESCARAACELPPELVCAGCGCAIDLLPAPHHRRCRA